MCTCSMRNFNFLASLCSQAGWFEYPLVGNPKTRPILYLCLRGFVNNKGSDQPVYPGSLINAFVIRLLESFISILATSEISIF